MRVLVTGGSGFCGLHLVSRLKHEPGVEIAWMARGNSSNSELALERYFQVDVRDRHAVESVVQSFQPDYVYHLAGASGNCQAPQSIYEVNIMGTVCLLEAIARFAPQCRVLLVGSAAEYGAVKPELLPASEGLDCHPGGPYGLSKYAATLIGIDYFKKCGLKVVIARPSNIVGPGIPKSLVVGALLERAQQALELSDPEVRVGDYDSERDFVDVRNVVDAYVRLMQCECWGEIFNISSGRPYSIASVAEMLLANSSRPIKIVYDSSFVAQSAVKKIYCSYEKSALAFDYSPSISLEESLKACWSHAVGSGVACA